jgi:hypothetical protein
MGGVGVVPSFFSGEAERRSSAPSLLPRHFQGARRHAAYSSLRAPWPRNFREALGARGGSAISPTSGESASSSASDLYAPKPQSAGSCRGDDRSERKGSRVAECDAPGFACVEQFRHYRDTPRSELRRFECPAIVWRQVLGILRRIAAGNTQFRPARTSWEGRVCSPVEHVALNPGAELIPIGCNRFSVV